MQTLLDTMVLDTLNVDAYLVAEVDKNQYTEFTFTVTLSPKFTGYLLQAIGFWQAFKRAFLWYLPQVIGLLFVACYVGYRATKVMVRTVRLMGDLAYACLVYLAEHTNPAIETWLMMEALEDPDQGLL